MSRAYIEDNVARVVDAGRNKGFRVSTALGAPVSSVEANRLSVDFGLSLPLSYIEFLEDANGLEIEFYLRRIPEDIYPAYTFQIAGVPEAFTLTQKWKTTIKEFIRGGECAGNRLPERDRALIDSLILINPYSKVLIDATTGGVFAEEFSELYAEDFLVRIATSLEEYFEQSVAIMIRDGYMSHS